MSRLFENGGHQLMMKTYLEEIGRLGFAGGLRARFGLDFATSGLGITNLREQMSLLALSPRHLLPK